MLYRQTMPRIAIVMLLGLLAACAAPPAQPLATTVPRPPSPSALPPSPVPPTPRADPAAPGAAALPAPLLLLERGQISRIAADGATRTRLTEETTALEGLLPITEFVVSPASGELLYIVGDVEVDRLVRADANGRNGQTLFSEQQLELSDLQIAPDGTTLALRLLNNREQPGPLLSGVYLLSTSGSAAPQLLVADDPVDDPVNPGRGLRKFAPLAFAPDGTRLLLRADSAFYDGCRAMVLPLAAPGAPVDLALGTGLLASCNAPAWSRDSATVFVLAEPADLASGPAGLFRADAASGASTLLVAPASGGEYAIVRAPFALPNGALAAFVGRSSTPPAPLGSPTETPLAMVRLDADAAGVPQPMGAETSGRFERGLWSPDGSGVAVLGNAEGAQTLTYLPAAGGPALQLPVTGDDLVAFQWGR